MRVADRQLALQVDEEARLAELGPAADLAAVEVVAGIEVIQDGDGVARIHEIAVEGRHAAGEDGC